MNSQTNHLPQNEIRTLRQLLRITSIRGFYLNKEEIDIIVPNQKKLEEYEEGYLNLYSREVLIKSTKNNRTIVTISLDDQYTMEDTSQKYDDHIEWHYSSLFTLIIKLFGKDALLEKLANTMNKQYDGISEGQAKAVLMKFVPSFREEPTAMSSVTRTQIYRLRQKLERYNKVVDAFFPLLIMENVSLEEIANNLPNYRKLTQAPYFANNKDLYLHDIKRMEPIIKEVSSSNTLQPVKQQTKQEKQSEIEYTRKKLLENGWDPDQDDEDEVEIDDFNNEVHNLYYICELCNRTLPYTTDQDGKISQPSHHNRPMTLKIRRKRSDY